MVIIGTIAKQVFRHRKWIYRTLVAQDRVVDKALRYGRVSKATRYGIRHGLVIGSVVGSLISNPMGDNGNGLPTFEPKLSPSRTQYKTRGGFTRRSSFERKRKNKYNPRCGCPSPC